jgi:hypothetical protein
MGRPVCFLGLSGSKVFSAIGDILLLANYRNEVDGQVLNF